jgi:hypothetical protein
MSTCPIVAWTHSFLVILKAIRNSSICVPQSYTSLAYVVTAYIYRSSEKPVAGLGQTIQDHLRDRKGPPLSPRGVTSQGHPQRSEAKQCAA